MIKNIIFDIGNVLVSFDPYRYVTEYGYDKETTDNVFNIVFRDKRWAELDRGTLANEDYMKSLVEANPQYEKEIIETFDNWYNMLEIKTESVEFFKELKEKGYKIYLLSNFAEKEYERLEREYDFFRMADGKIISYAVKKIKPEREIYELLLEKYNLKAEECVFLDDLESNINGAENVGIHGIIFKNLAFAKDELENIIKNELNCL